MGDLTLESAFDARKALTHYSEAIAWFETIEAKDAELEQYRVPSKAFRVTAPPVTMKERDDWGNVTWSKIGPNDVVNRTSMHWYVDHHRMMTRARRALCHFMLGDKEAALADLEVIREVDGYDRERSDAGMLSNYGRLTDGVERGRFFATEEELALFEGKARVMLLLAEWDFEMERWPEAEARYREIWKQSGEGRRINSDQAAYLRYVLACCRRMAGDDAGARDLVAPFLEGRYRRSPTFARAVMLAAALTPEIERKEALLRGLYEAYADEPGQSARGKVAREALFVLGQYLYSHSRYEAARAAFEEVRSVSDRAWVKRAAGTYLKMVKDAQAGEEG